eukprot:11348-Heterococcus_DN1.PRE.3
MTSVTFSALLLLLRCDMLQIGAHTQNNQHVAGTVGVLCGVVQCTAHVRALVLMHPLHVSVIMIVDTATLLPAAVVVIAIVVATKLFSKHQQKLKKVEFPGTRSLTELPSPPALPLLGHNVTLMRHGITDAPALIQRWSEQHGDAYTIKLRTLWLVLSDPKDVKNDDASEKFAANLMFCQSAVLDARPGTFDREKQLCDPFIQSGFDGVVAQNGETWKRHRRITSSAFSRPNIKNAVPKTNSVARVLVDKLAQCTEGGKETWHQGMLRSATSRMPQQFLSLTTAVHMTANKTAHCMH